MECTDHPGAAAVGSCVVCQKGLCEACREWVAGYAMCRPCVAAEQERLRGEEAARAGPGGAASAAAPAATDGPADPRLPCGPRQYVRAVVYAGVAAVIGAILWDKFVLWTGWKVGLIAVAVGWGVGTALCLGAEARPGRLLPGLAALMAALGIMLGYGMLQQEVVMASRPELAAEIEQLSFLLQRLLFTLNAPFNLRLMDWIFVAIGVWQAWAIARNLNRQAGVAPEPAAGSPAPVAPAAESTMPNPAAETPGFAAPPPPMGAPREGEGKA